ncbi:MAG: translation initiation factor IF-1 [Acidobacteriota bacterium]|nr:translation initiation factor IF-1 [Acidobacteriota bacterium]
MGVDQALKVPAVVVELLPSELVRVKLENQELVLAHAASATKANFVRLRAGDRVEVELSAQDHTRGRILRLIS